MNYIQKYNLPIIKIFFNCEAILKIINAVNKSYHSIIIDNIGI